MKETAVEGLGEIAFRVEDMDAMRTFYEDVIRLPVLQEFEDVVFFELGSGVEGHTQVFALFDRRETDGYEGIDPIHTTVDHIAFGIELADFESEKARLEDLGFDVDTATHEWVGWRSLYVSDPENNQVELVCYDPSLSEQERP